MGFPRGGGEGVAAQDLSESGVGPGARHGIGEAEGGGREERRIAFPRQPRDLPRVPQAAGERLVDEQALPRREDGPRLLEVGPAVHAHDQDGIHLPAERFDRVHDFDPEFLLELAGEVVHAGAAGFDVGTAALEAADDARPGDVMGILGVVEELGEGDHVGSVQPDHPQPERRLRLLGGPARRQKAQKNDPRGGFSQIHGHTFSGTTKGLRYSRVRRRSASSQPLKVSETGSKSSIRPTKNSVSSPTPLSRRCARIRR